MKKHPRHPDEITAKWFTEVLKEAGLIVNSNVVSIKKEQIAQGKAWLSTILRVEVEYDSPIDSAPNSFVLKLLSESRSSRDFSYERQAYEREINFYNEVADTIPIHLPKLFYSVTGPDCNLLLMEDLSNLTAGDQIRGMNYEQVLITLESLAKVHSTYWTNPILDSFNWMPCTNNIDVDYDENWDSFVELCGDFIDPEGLRIGEKLRTRIPWLLEEISKRPKTLVHDDMKVDNLLFGNAGTNEEVVILDWQFAIRGMGAIDVARLIGGSMFPREREGHHFEALRYWHDKLLDNGVENYNWEEAQRDYKLGALSCLTFPVHFHKGITRAHGRALEYIKILYSGLFLFALAIDADSILS